MNKHLFKTTLLALTALLVLNNCGGEGKSGSTSNENLLNEDYIFIEPIIVPPTPTPPSPTPPTPTPPSPTPSDNTAPVANAGDNQDVDAGTFIKLDGSGSYDVDDDPLKYKWVLVEKPSASTATLVGATTINPTFTADVDGHYRIKLVVNDGKVNSRADTVYVTVNTPVPTNTPPIAVIKGPSSLVVTWSGSNTVLYYGTSSRDDGFIEPLTYTWTSGPYTANTPKVQAKTSCSADWQRCYNAEQRPICTYKLSLKVFDGEFSDTDSVNLKVDYSACEHDPIVEPDSIHLDPAYTQTIPVTKHKTYKLWAYYPNGKTKDVTADAVLSTSDTSIATINASGQVTGISVGDVLIIADYAGQRDTAPLTVTK